ncbi:011L [Invertebrate iridescent virus Kaz2018]|nr:011L [Invertebrate iridescent virus Kaz2018]
MGKYRFYKLICFNGNLPLKQLSLFRRTNHTSSSSSSTISFRNTCSTITT